MVSVAVWSERFACHRRIRGERQVVQSRREVEAAARLFQGYLRFYEKTVEAGAASKFIEMLQESYSRDSRH